MIQQEPLIRASFFFGIFGMMALWESIAPCRRLLLSRPQRWASNLGLVVLNTLLLRALFPLAGVGVAAFAASQGWGLFHSVAFPHWVAILLSVVALDLAIYGQHVLFHKVPLFWRLHQVHHVDRDFDVTTGLRFHPLEILLSIGIKCGVILLLGAPPLAVLIFEVLLNASAMITHANITIPRPIDRLLRSLVVTPDMHRIHHSIIPQETNSNYGFTLAWWDYLFGTYRATATKGDQGITIGLAEFQDTDKVGKLPWMLVLPFKRKRQ